MPYRARGALSSLQSQALIHPLAQQGPAGFLFSGGSMQLDFAKLDGLVPAIIQDAGSGEVLMLGFMNEQAYRETR